MDDDDDVDYSSFNSNSDKYFADNDNGYFTEDIEIILTMMTLTITVMMITVATI